MSWELLGSLQGPAGRDRVTMASPWIPQRGSDAWNDEFDDSGSPDLGVRGWTVENWSTGATLTRAGDVTWHAGASLGSTQYRSTLVGSELWLQTPSGVSMFIYKTFPAASYVFGMQGTVPYYESGFELKLWVYNATRNASLPERNAFGTGVYTSGSGAGNAQFIYTNNAGTQSWNTGGTNTFGNDGAVQDCWTCDLRSSAKVAQMSWETSTMRNRWTRAAQIAGVTTTAVAAGVQVTSGGVASLQTGAAMKAIVLGWLRRDGSTPL